MGRKIEVEKDWTTASGLRAVVLMTDLGHRCGYVGVPAGHSLHGVGYSQNTEALPRPSDDTEIGKRGVMSLLYAKDRMQSPEIVFDVHGSLTYAGGSEDYPVPSDGLWWFGYDCGHAGDAPAPGSRMTAYAGDVHRTLDYCERECESLAQQIVSKTVPPAAA